MAVKTNAARKLDELGIRYEMRTFDVSEEHLSAGEVAERLGVPKEQVYKTLLATGDRTGPLFAVVSAEAEVDLKAVARASQNRSVEMVPLGKLTQITGYVRGGTTALAAKKELPVVIDALCLLVPQISVSAGVRGVQLLLSPEDYVRATKAITAEISRAPNVQILRGP